MIKQHYIVLENFDSKKDYGIPIRSQYAKCLSTLQKGQIVSPTEFTKKHLNEFTNKPRCFDTNRDITFHSFAIGKKIGILQEQTPKEKGIAMPYDEFCKLDSVEYYIEQLRGSRYRNIDPKKIAGTASAYSNRLWNFNNWISGKSFEFYVEIQTGKDTFQRKRESVIIDSVEHFLKLYQEPYSTKQDFIRAIKKYFLDPMHKGKRASTLRIDYCAIRAYFEKNDTPLYFKLDLKAKYQTTNEEEQSLSLDEFMALLTEGKPSLTQKAVFLCKFHRGLDTSTFVDRFNFQAWEQLVEYFGTSKYEEWSLDKCPAPIKLTRMKTDYTHTGFLDKDAILAIQKYLDHRKKKTGKNMEKEEALFLNAKNEPISNNWIENSLKRLAENSGLKKEIKGYLQTRYKITSHEVRDLLKSTLIDSGTRYDLADHFIGHKPKDSYEKQTKLYTETMRDEYSKASERLNVFSNFTTFCKGNNNTEQLKKHITKLEDEQKIHIETQKTMLTILREKQIIP